MRGVSIFCQFLLNIAFGGLSWMFFLILIIHHSPFIIHHFIMTFTAIKPFQLQCRSRCSRKLIVSIQINDLSFGMKLGYFNQ